MINELERDGFGSNAVLKQSGIRLLGFEGRREFFFVHGVCKVKQ